jgi:hypothetical protein
MKHTVNFYNFERSFVDMNRDNNFSYAGKKALFDYLEEYEDSTGEEIELDVIALCGDFTEYENAAEFAGAYSDDYLAWDTEPEPATPVYFAGWNMPGYMPASEPAEFDDADDAKNYILEELESAADQLQEEIDATKLEEIQQAIDGLTNSTDIEQGFNAGGYFYFITATMTEATEGELDYEATLDKIRDSTQVIDIDGESFIIQDF